MNIYVDDTTLYGCTSRYPDGQNLTADLSSDLALAALWGKNWSHSIPQKQSCNDPASPSSLWISIYLSKRPLSLNSYQDLSSPQISSLNMLGKWSVNTCLLRPCSTVTRTISDRKLRAVVQTSLSSLKVQKPLCRLVRDELFSTLQALTKRCEPFATLSLFPWKMLKRATFPQLRPAALHVLGELPSFFSYFFIKEWVPVG